MILLQVTKCIPVPVLRHSTTYTCIQGTCASAIFARTCVPIQSSINENEFDTNTVYEVLADHMNTEEIENTLHSTFLGDKLHSIHDMEVDFVLPSAAVNGLMVNPYGRRLNWYLMKVPQIPLTSCSDDPFCIQYVVSDNGIGAFQRVTFLGNTKYYICTHGNPMNISFEFSTTYLPRLSSCGNGFIVDDEAPIAGKVQIKSNKYLYVVDSRELSITWYGFSDSGALVDSHHSGIAYYSFAIGMFHRCS